MTEIVDILDHMQHVVIEDIEGDQHVIPSCVIERIISGSMEIEELEEWKIIIRAVLEDWFNSLELRD
ncbi:MAG: hypothetical protein JKY33_10640 [Bacteroidia bacterium]|nr:hypothetical protein [Bacteroidia bacterium]